MLSRFCYIMNPDQLASVDSCKSGSTLFCTQCTYQLEYSVYMYLYRVLTSYGNHGKSRKKSSMHGKMMEFE